MAEISVIIPAYNEERLLAQTLESIRQHLGGLGYSYELIVADHGSTDRTAMLARDGGAVVLERKDDRTVAALRNAAVSVSSGFVLLFLDADITLTAEWAGAFPDAYRQLTRDPLEITGAKTAVPPTAGWVSRMWLRRRPTENPTHLGTGHMITTRPVYDLVGGFREELETGEDYEFCVRARRLGVRIVARQSLRAFHHGVPATLRQYFVQQVWHGRGEWQGITAVLGSKVAMATMAFLVLHLIGVSCVIAGGTWRIVAALAAASVLSLCLASSYVQYRGQGMTRVLGNAALFYLYYVARVASLGSVLWRRAAQKRVRDA